MFKEFITKTSSFIRKNSLTILGSFLGLIGGYAYYKFVGCSSGACAITSDPLKSSLYGMIMGGLLFSSFVRNKEEKTSL